MSIEEIAARMSKSDYQLFTELVSEVESQSAQVDILVPGQKTFHGISEGFRLERNSVKVICNAAGMEDNLR